MPVDDPKKQLKLLEAKLKEEFKYLQSVYDLTKKISSANGNLFLTKVRDIPSRRIHFERLLEQQQYLEMDVDENYEPDFKRIAAYDELADEVLNVAKVLQDKIDAAKTTTTETPVAKQEDSHVKFPRLTLPTFDGKVENWPTFHQLFEELVHKSTRITSLEKVNYLVTHLTGPAKSICAGIPATAENYELLYETLVERYEDVRSLGSHYLEKIINFRALSSDTEKDLLSFLENFVEPALALKQLKIGSFFDFFMIFMAMKKLDGETVRQFELNSRDVQLPKFDDLHTFVRDQAKIAARRKVVSAPKSNPAPAAKKTHAFVAQSNNVSEEVAVSPASSKAACVVCSGKPHALYRCSGFKKLAIPARFDLIKRNRLCFNCFSHRHSSFECSSERTCQKCHKKHNSLIHFENNSGDGNSKNSASSESAPDGVSPGSTSLGASPEVETKSASVVHSFLSSSVQDTTVLLATARVAVQDRHGQRHTIRALLDNGSQSHFLTKQCCTRLGISTKSSKIVVDCLSSKSTVSREQATFSFSSLVQPDIQFRITACVLDEIANNLPSVPVSISAISHLQGLELADEELHRPGPIDLLIGASLWADIVGVGRLTGPAGSPVAMESVLGWIVIGDVPVIDSARTTHSFLAVSEAPLEVLMEKFWSSENVPEAEIMDPEDAACEEHFVNNVSRRENGQYVVALPFKRSPDLLGESYNNAVKRFLSLEKRHLKQPDLHRQYVEVMSGHIANGYMSLVPPAKLDNPSYYVPHHGVFKPSSSSTPLRVVWNMSASTSSGYSLNDLMYVGAKLQKNMTEILLNYRLFEFALSADVRQMYLRIGVKPDDRRFQRLIWRKSPEEALKIYEMNCLAFGLTPAPYLAQRVVRDLADRERHRFPASYEIVNRDLYMDDVATSVASEDEACALQRELTKFFAAGYFTLAKWCSNSPRVMEQVPHELRLFGDQPLDMESHTKILGLFWEPTSDTFQFKSTPIELVFTKRAILSNIAKIYDPLGFLAPLVTAAKILMKSLWMLQIDWDDAPPDPIKIQWSKFVAELPAVSSIAIPRHSGVFLDMTTELIGFADASQSAYGAVVYVRSRSNSARSNVTLLWAKSKVAPAQTKSIPRLELCAAVLLSKLLRYTVDLYAPRHKFDRIMAFTDSMVTLQWISAPPSRWQTYVSNRVALIQENVGASCWRHVRGDANPADCLSRGLSGYALIDHPMWFPGPPWLQENEDQWPVTSVSELKFETAPNEMRVVKLNTNVPEEWILAPLVTRVSSLHKLHRITAWVLRAARLTSTRCAGLRMSEVIQAEQLWLRHVQKTHFAAIIEELQATRFQKKRKRREPLVKRLSLFLDGDGLIRVGGRLDKSDLTYEQKHPILLPKGHPYVTLVVDQCHRDNLHTGPFLLMALLRMKFWILSARTLVRSRVHSCNICFKSKPKPNTPKMASLPKFRLQQAKAFTHSGVDYAGPITITMNRHRGNRTIKAYICLFVCMSTKAIHLELASDLSTPCFLAAFHRFLSRRGPVAVMYSDQGTNFIGARSVLKEVYEFAKSHHFNNSIEADLAAKKIEWKMNPPSAPHHGGLWEANVKSVKTHLNKIVGNQILTYEEMATVLTQVEALLNSRPLCPLSGDPQAPVALTPAHFLTFGSTLDAFPEKDVTDVPSNRLTHYERVSQIVQHYWKRWSQEYLHELQQRYKWQDDVSPLEIGNVVVIMKENTAPLHWPLAIVKELFIGDDGKIRSAKVRTASGDLIRPAVKLCVLPTQ